MPHAYTEDQLVEKPAIQLFGEMGWETVSGLDEVPGMNGTLGRHTTADVVLDARLRVALTLLNPWLTPEALNVAVDTLARSRSTMSPAAANREVYSLL
jgi:type I restriction enzyme R subunit